VVVKRTLRLPAVAHRAGWLTVGPYQVWTTLTAQDLANPALWTLQSPLAWAARVVRMQTKCPPERMPDV
jgi:hypothetical protein